MDENDSNEIKQKKEDSRVKQKIRKLTWKQNKELESMEENIMNAEEEVERIEGIFSSLDFYEKYAAQTNELSNQLEDAKNKVKELYDRWEELERIKKEIEER